MSIYDNIGVAHQQTVDVLRRWGANLTAAQLGRIEAAFQNVEAHATDSSAWSAVQNAHEVSAQVARESVPRLTQANLDELQAHFQRISSWMPGQGTTIVDVLTAPIDLAASGAKGLTDLAGGIPLIGPALHGVLIIASGPFTFTQQVAHGANVSQALISDLRDKLQGVKEVAPYAQTVISFVPGIGQGVNAAIGAGLALAQGQPIDKALIAGVRAAIPGGPAAKAAFDLTVAAASGDNMITAAGNVAIGNLGLPPEATQAAAQAFNVVYRAAKGENIPLAVLDQARNYLPNDPNVRKAFDIGLAVAQGKRLQDVAVSELVNLAPQQIAKIKSVVPELVQDSPALGIVRNVIANPTVKSGYELGMSLAYHTGANDRAIDAVRSKLSPDERRGFDTGVSSFYTMKAGPPGTLGKDPSKAAGYALAKGTENQSLSDRLKIFTQITDPRIRAGIAYREQERQAKEGFFGWLWRLVFG